MLGAVAGPSMPSWSDSAAGSADAGGAVGWLLACSGTANVAVPAHLPASCTATMCKGPGWGGGEGATGVRGWGGRGGLLMGVLRGHISLG